MDASIVDDFVAFIQEDYADAFRKKHNAPDVRCSKLIKPESEDGSVVIIVQFFIEYQLTDQEEFLQENIETFSSILLERFDGQVLSFQTLMEVIPQ